MIFDTHTHYDADQFDEDREAVLLSLADFGGGPGALAAMYLFRHKTIFKTKYHFIISVWLAAGIQTALAMYTFIVTFK